MRLKTVFIATILFSSLLLGTGTFFGSFTDNYNVSGENNLNSISKTQEIEDNSTDLMNRTSQIATGGVIGRTKSFFLAIPQVFGYMFSIPAMATGLAQDTISETGAAFIPSWVIPMIVALIASILALIVVSAVIKWRL